MYDVVVIGQGLSGMLSAIWAKEQGFRTALAAAGTGKILQSTGVIDLIPGSDGNVKDWMERYQLEALNKSQLVEAVRKFQVLSQRLGYPYKGDIDHISSIVTGSGHVKRTALYPETILPIPEEGNIAIVGFQEVSDFQPSFVKGNLQKALPHLTINTMKISLGKNSQRTMTQLDAARLLDHQDVRSYCIRQIKDTITEKKMDQPDMFVFPASLGVENWKETLQQFSSELGARVTEAPGMPPNTTAVRLNECLKKEAVKLGVRFYTDTTVVGCSMDGDEIKSLKIKTANQIKELTGNHYILASGGILGGGLETAPDGIKETVLGLEVDRLGEFLNCPINLHPIGASRGMKVTQYGITGGMYSIFSSHETITKLQQFSIGGTRSA